MDDQENTTVAEEKVWTSPEGRGLTFLGMRQDGATTVWAARVDEDDQKRVYEATVWKQKDTTTASGVEQKLSHWGSAVRVTRLADGSTLRESVTDSYLPRHYGEEAYRKSVADAMEAIVKDIDRPLPVPPVVVPKRTTPPPWLSEAAQLVKLIKDEKAAAGKYQYRYGWDDIYG